MKTRNYLVNAIRLFEPQMIGAWQEALASVASEVQFSVLVDHLRAGNLIEAMNMVEVAPEQFLPLDDAIRSSYRAGFDATSGAIPTIMREGNPLVMRLNPRNLRAESWMANHSGTMIRDLSNTARQTIRDHLVYGLQNGTNPRVIARELIGNLENGRRVGGVLGLTPTQLSHVQSYRAALESGDASNALGRALRSRRYDRLLSSGKELTSEQIDNIVASYQNNYLKHRAQVIAEQETRSSMSQARREVFQQTIDKGYLTNQQIRRFWIIRTDDRVRNQHKEIPELNKNGVAFDEAFTTSEGPVFDAPHGIGCRCYVDIRIDLQK